MIAKWKSEKEVLDAVHRNRGKIEALKLENEQAKRMGDLTRASEITYGETSGGPARPGGGKGKAQVKCRRKMESCWKEEVTEGDIAISGCHLDRHSRSTT